MYAHSPLVAQRNPGIIEKQESILTVAALIRIHLISHLDLMWIVTEGRRAYTKRRTSHNKSPATVQMSLF